MLNESLAPVLYNVLRCWQRVKFLSSGVLFLSPISHTKLGQTHSLAFLYFSLLHRYVQAGRIKTRTLIAGRVSSSLTDFKNLRRSFSRSLFLFGSGIRLLFYSIKDSNFNPKLFLNSENEIPLGKEKKHFFIFF